MNKHAHYVVFDTETGGTDTQCSLLSATFLTLDKDMNPMTLLELQVKPDSGIYSVTAEALSINKISLAQHDKIATTYTEAANALEAFLRIESNNGQFKITPIGHNVDFDLGFVKQYLLPQKTWEQYVSYRKICTASVAAFLKASGVLAQNQGISLGALAKHYRIPTGTLHNATEDVKITAAVLRKMTGKAI